MTPDELRKLQSKYPVSASVARLNLGAPAPDGADQNHDLGEQPSVAQPIVRRAAPQKVPHQKGNPARYLVRITDFRTRLLDEDNLCAKYHIDALRYSGLLPSDAPGRCKISVSQEKVTRKKEVRVEIFVFPPGSWTWEDLIGYEATGTLTSATGQALQGSD